MNYRHYYHVGNFADVFKHVLLVGLIQSLLRKDTAFCYVDTHAGVGRYDLSALPVQKNPEYLTGIAKILEKPNLPVGIKQYLKVVQAANPGVSNLTADNLHFYPGSPMIVRGFLRPQDRMILSELHPDDCDSLKQVLKNDPRIAIHNADGYQNLKALLPPAEKRGVVLIDPPFEQPDEWDRMVTGLNFALERWRHGTYAIWYPMKDRRLVERFYRQLKKNNIPKTLSIELNLNPDDTISQLNGCGLVVVNPPWQFDILSRSVLPYLLDAFSPERKGYYKVSWLVPE